MGRGLSTQQLSILGHAAAVNWVTNRGQFKVKTGPNWQYQGKLEWRKDIQYPGTCDITYRLAEHWVYELPFVSEPIKVKRKQKLRDGYTDRQTYEQCIPGPEYLGKKTGATAAATVAIKRAVKSLIERGLMVQTDGREYMTIDHNPVDQFSRYEHFRWQWGMTLTEAGLEIGIENLVEPDDLRDCVKMLGGQFYMIKSRKQVFHLAELLDCPEISSGHKQDVKRILQGLKT